VVEELRINNQIRAQEVRLIGSDGKIIGIVPVREALAMATEEGLDLVEISPRGIPPVCKIANYGKIRYQTQKKAAEARKRQKVVDTKEIKLSLNIAKGDYELKLKQTQKFLEQGHRVRFSFQFRGREISHANLAEDMAREICSYLSTVAKAEVAPHLEGKKLFFLLVPLKAKKTPIK
jgi:translation initiation factor IF-3